MFEWAMLAHGKPMSSNLQKLRSLSRRDLPLLAEALGCLALGRIEMLRVPFRELATRMGRLDGESPQALPGGREDVARRIGWAVQAMARRIPWNGLCLTQALAAVRMLKRRGIPFTLHLGVRMDSSGRHLFHAWVRSGGCRVTGGRGAGDYQVLGQFGSEPLAGPEREIQAEWDF